VEAQERQTQITQSFFASVDDILRAQAKSNFVASQGLAEQAIRGQEAAQALAQESVAAYVGFLNSMFSFYQRAYKQPAEAPSGAETRASDE
jgi:hypothetical protein